MIKRFMWFEDGKRSERKIFNEFITKFNVKIIDEKLGFYGFNIATIKFDGRRTKRYFKDNNIVNTTEFRDDYELFINAPAPLITK